MRPPPIQTHPVLRVLPVIFDVTSAIPDGPRQANLPA
jgi:hypothetical protein